MIGANTFVNNVIITMGMEMALKGEYHIPLFFSCHIITETKHANKIDKMRLFIPHSICSIIYDFQVLNTINYKP